MRTDVPKWFDGSDGECAVESIVLHARRHNVNPNDVGSIEKF